MRLLAERLKFYAMLGNGSMLSDRVQPKVRLLCRVGREIRFSCLPTSGSSDVREVKNEPPPPKFSASGRGRCRALGGVAYCLGADLSLETSYDRGAIRRRRSFGFACTLFGRAYAVGARSAH